MLFYHRRERDRSPTRQVLGVRVIRQIKFSRVELATVGDRGWLKLAMLQDDVAGTRVREKERERARQFLFFFAQLHLLVAGHLIPLVG